MAKLSEAQLYGPISKSEWDAIEAEIERQSVGMTYLEKVASGWTLDLRTGEIKRQVP